VPVKYSAGPFVARCEPFLLTSIDTSHQTHWCDWLQLFKSAFKRPCGMGA
jgi:hypothetical protein